MLDAHASSLSPLLAAIYTAFLLCHDEIRLEWQNRELSRYHLWSGGWRVCRSWKQTMNCLQNLCAAQLSSGVVSNCKLNIEDQWRHSSVGQISLSLWILASKWSLFGSLGYQGSGRGLLFVPTACVCVLKVEAAWHQNLWLSKKWDHLPWSNRYRFSSLVERETTSQTTLQYQTPTFSATLCNLCPVLFLVFFELVYPSLLHEGLLSLLDAHSSYVSFAFRLTHEYLYISSLTFFDFD